LKPWFVQRLKEFNTCCYQYHIELRELKDGFNNIRLCGPDEVCICECNEVCNPLIFTHDQHQTPSCLSNESILKGVIDFWQKIVCAKLEFQE
jgi:hypothetical protein